MKRWERAGQKLHAVGYQSVGACRGDAVVVAVVRAVQPRTAKERHHNLARIRLRVTTRVWVRAFTT